MMTAVLLFAGGIAVGLLIGLFARRRSPMGVDRVLARLTSMTEHAETARVLSASERGQIDQLLALLRPVLVVATAGLEGIDRIEAEGGRVATELAASTERADAAEGEPGAAADAASTSGPVPEDPQPGG